MNDVCYWLKYACNSLIHTLWLVHQLIRQIVKFPFCGGNKKGELVLGPAKPHRNSLAFVLQIVATVQYMLKHWLMHVMVRAYIHTHLAY